MTRIVAALASLASLCAACAAPEDGAGAPAEVAPIGVYLVVLQSNAVGGAHAIDLPSGLVFYADPDPSVLQAYALNCPKDGIDGECSLVAGWSALAPRGSVSAFGVELSMGRQIAGWSSSPIAILKVATNGTGLQAQWEPSPAPEGGVWQWDYMERTIAQRLAELPAGSWIAGVALVGCEGDAGILTRALAVDDELAWWILAFRRAHGEVPIVITELSAPGLAYTAEVAARQWRVPELIDRVAVVATGDLVFRDAVQHYDAASFVELGNRIGAAFEVLP